MLQRAEGRTRRRFVHGPEVGKSWVVQAGDVNWRVLERLVGVPFWASILTAAGQRLAFLPLLLRGLTTVFHGCRLWLVALPPPWLPALSLSLP